MKKKFILLLTFLLLAPSLTARAIPLYNPLDPKNDQSGINSIPEFVNSFVRGVLGLVGAVALFFLIYGGITWMMSGGNAEKIKAGKETIKWAIFGLAIIFLSYVIIGEVIKLLGGNG